MQDFYCRVIINCEKLENVDNLRPQNILSVDALCHCASCNEGFRVQLPSLPGPVSCQCCCGRYTVLRVVECDANPYINTATAGAAKDVMRVRFSGASPHIKFHSNLPFNNSWTGDYTAYPGVAAAPYHVLDWPGLAAGPFQVMDDGSAQVRVIQDYPLAVVQGLVASWMVEPGYDVGAVFLTAGNQQ